MEWAWHTTRGLNEKGTLEWVHLKALFNNPSIRAHAYLSQECQGYPAK